MLPPRVHNTIFVAEFRHIFTRPSIHCRCHHRVYLLGSRSSLYL